MPLRISINPRLILSFIAGSVFGAAIMGIALSSTTPSPPATTAPEPTPIVATAQPEAVATVTVPAKTGPENPILDLFQPSDGALEQQLSETHITQQIENALVVCYTLVHCNMLSQTEYNGVFQDLVAYATRSHLADASQADAKVRSIADAASASYALVYSNANCSDPSLAQKAAALSQWRAAMHNATAPAPAH